MEATSGLPDEYSTSTVQPRMFGECVYLLLNVMTPIKREDKAASVIIAMPYLHF